MNFTKSERNGLTAALVALLIFAACLQGFIDPLRRQNAIEPPQAKKALGIFGPGMTMPFEYSLGAVTGFRQVIAGLLWVRSDAFFHEGNYDAILPLIRLITWLDPNWLDPYSTGAWHLMYNFTDTDQRSDRRYIPAGLALLREGVDNNPQIFDMYKELGWNNFDKIKNFSEALKWYKAAEAADPNYDVTTVGHELAHCYERMGDIPDAIAEWQKCVARHKALMDSPSSNPDVKSRNTMGYANAQKNLNLLIERAKFYVKDSQPPVDAHMTVKVTRKSPKIIEISGTFDLQGSNNWSDASGILLSGPRGGGRIDVRLQDAGYVVPEEKEFSFEVDKNLTIMQDSLSIHSGRKVTTGSIYLAQKVEAGTDPMPAALAVGVYGFGPISGKDLGVPIAQALASGGSQISANGRMQLVSIAYPLPMDPTGKKEKQYTPAEVDTLFAKLKSDTTKIAALNSQGYCVATRDATTPGTFSRTIDMSKDPGMYSFTAPKYDLIISFNPQGAPDFVKDRIGWIGEGLTDDRFLDTKTIPGVHLIRDQVELSRDDLTGSGDKVLVAQ